MTTSIVSSVAIAGETDTQENKILSNMIGTSTPSIAHARALTPSIPVVVEQTTALIIGGSAANTAYLLGIIILANGTAVTVDVAGFEDEDGDAKTIRFTGSTTADVVLNFGSGILNTKGALTVTSSVADKAIILYWAAV